MKGCVIMFENKIINGVHATRYIASWTEAGGTLHHRSKDFNDFVKWMRTLDLSEDDVQYIKNLATNGKMEFQDSAKQFLKDR